MSRPSQPYRWGMPTHWQHSAPAVAAACLVVLPSMAGDSPSTHQTMLYTYSMPTHVCP